MLGCYRRIIGLGEIYGVLNDILRAHKSLCGCGETATDCSFWGWLLKQLFAAPENDRYKMVFNEFKHQHPNMIPVDSSKNIKALKQLQTIDGLDIRVIYLVRDVRAWIASYRKYPGKGLRQKSAMRLYLRWYKNNKAIEKYLNQSGLDVYQIGYEELILNKHQSMKKLSEFIGVDGDSCELTESLTHNLGGNRMLHDKRKRQRVVYDARWMTNKEWILPSILFPMVIQWNNRHVHGNIKNVHGK
jgi:hypothetical protein